MGDANPPIRDHLTAIGDLAKLPAGEALLLAVDQVARFTTFACDFTMSGLSTGHGWMQVRTQPSRAIVSKSTFIHVDGDRTMRTIKTENEGFFLSDSRAPAGNRPWARLGYTAEQAGQVIAMELALLSPAEIAAQCAASPDVRTVGTEVLNDVQVVHYAASIDPREGNPDTGLRSVNLDLWLPASLLPVKAVRRQVALISDDEDIKSITYRDYGAEVDIVVPPADQIGSLRDLRLHPYHHPVPTHRQGFMSGTQHVPGRIRTHTRAIMVTYIGESGSPPDHPECALTCGDALERVYRS